MNWPVQSTGSEMLRAALVRLEDGGVTVLTPVHDAVLIEAPVDEIEDAVRLAQEAMSRAARDVLGEAVGMRSDAQVVLPGQSFLPPASQGMWDAVTRAIGGTHA